MLIAGLGGAPVDGLEVSEGERYGEEVAEMAGLDRAEDTAEP